MSGEYTLATTGCRVISLKFDGSFVLPFLWIKIVKAYFQCFWNNLFIQQCSKILCSAVLKIGQRFILMMLSWSCGHGEPLDFNLVDDFGYLTVSWRCKIKHSCRYFKSLHPAWEFIRVVYSIFSHCLFKMSLTSAHVEIRFLSPTGF